MTKIFATGVTGFIGGDAIVAIANAHPEYDVTCLVRNSDKAASVAKDHGSFKFVYGDLDSAELLEEEAKKADIVLHCAHATRRDAVEALLRGLQTHEPSRPGFLIHTSGTGILMYEDATAQRFGEPSDKVYDDLAGLPDIRAIPTSFSHRGAEELILHAGKVHADRVKTAIVAPPCIYGRGRGPGNQRSLQIPELVRNSLEKGHGITVGRGKDVWSGVHVQDLSALFLKLVENAAAGESLAEWPGKPALWGEEGYYFCESGKVVFDRVAQQIAHEAKRQGFCEGEEVKAVTPEEAAGMAHYGHLLWGCNSRSQAKRAREALRWAPSAMGLEEVVKEQVELEARALGLQVGHARKAAGDA